MRFSISRTMVGFLWLSLSATAWAVNPASGTTGSGQDLNIIIDTPTDGDTIPEGLTVVEGVTSVGPLTANAAVSYVVDISGSTGGSGGLDCNGDGLTDAGDDINGDGRGGNILDCEIAGVIALNEGFAGISGLEASLITFNSSANTLDLDPVTAGGQAFVAPDADADANLQSDVEDAAVTLRSGGGTDFDDALTEMNATFATRPAGENHVAFFLSDGHSYVSTGTGSPLQDAVDAGTVVNTYSVGSGGTGCNVGDELRTISDSTGGTCTDATDPTTLSSMISGVTPAGIDRVEVALDGGAAVDGAVNATGNYSATLAINGLGSHVITATSYADDGSAVTADITVFIGPEGECVEDGLNVLLPEANVASNLVHGSVWSFLVDLNTSATGSGLEFLTEPLPDTVHDVNCNVVVPWEGVLDNIAIGLGL